MGSQFQMALGTEGQSGLKSALSQRSVGKKGVVVLQ